MLGTKLYGGQACKAGSIIVRQRGQKIKAGAFVGMVILLAELAHTESAWELTVEVTTDLSLTESPVAKLCIVR